MSYISQIKLPNNTTYDINSKTVNGHTVASDVPSNAVFTDTNDAVTQTSSTTNSNFEILLSGTADDVTRTEGVKKSQYALFNPNKKAFTFGTRAANSSIGEYSTSEGSGNTASGAYSHVEGLQTSATYSSAHAEGAYTSASGGYAHAEGYHTTASVYAHAEGNYTTASGYHSHAEGYYTTATHKSQHVFGEYNVLDTSSADSDERGTYVEIVGKGTADNARSNARTLDWSGNEVLAGNLTIGGRLTAKSLSLPDRGDLYLFGYSDTDTSFAWLNNNKLSVHDYDTEHSVLELTATDLIFPGLIIEGTEYNNTWDGTHSSLKDTITYLASQSAVNKVDYIHSTDASEYTIDTLANTDSLAVMGVTLSGTPTANHGAFLNVKNVGTPFQLFMPDNVRYIYKRYKNNSTGAYYDWFKLDAGYADTSGKSNYNNVPRISKDSRYKPGVNTLAVEEFQNNSANLPNANWYHIYTSEGSDSAYAVQLALGMTVDGAYYRKCSANSWGGWIDLIRPTWANVSGKPTVIYANGGSKNVTAGTILNCCSFTLSAGTYLIIYMTGFPAGQANWKTCGAVIATANNSSTPINQAGLCNYRYGYDNETRVHGSTMHTVSANTTLYLNLWGRGSGALAGCFGEVRAIRLY